MQTGPARMSEAMTLFRSWAEKKGLLANETQYVARTPQRQALRFRREGDAAIEVFYRTHWFSPELSERKRERLVEKAGRPPPSWSRSGRCATTGPATAAAAAAIF